MSFECRGLYGFVVGIRMGCYIGPCMFIAFVLGCRAFRVCCIGIDFEVHGFRDGTTHTSYRV